MNDQTAAAFAAVLGVGRFDSPLETPELRKELAVLRRQIRAGATDRALVRTIRRITALRLRASRAAKPWPTLLFLPRRTAGLSAAA